MKEALLQVNDLTKNYPGFTLDHISFEIPKGKIMGLVGENGAGKSTTIHIICGLVNADGGDVRFWGKERITAESVREEIGVVFDNIHFHETLTPVRVGHISSLAYKRWDKNLYDSYLDHFRLPKNKEIKTFSKGMKMKLCIAAALAHRPELLILDEATNGLDPVMRAEVLELFEDFVRDGERSILMSSHISSDLEKAADYITLIHRGKVMFCGSKEELHQLPYPGIDDILLHYARQDKGIR